jgi:hypothetical protein
MTRSLPVALPMRMRRRRDPVSLRTSLFYGLWVLSRDHDHAPTPDDTDPSRRPADAAGHHAGGFRAGPDHRNTGAAAIDAGAAAAAILLARPAHHLTPA